MANDLICSSSLDPDHELITNQIPTVSPSTFSNSASSFLTTCNNDDEFVFKLTRQMAEYMLQEDDNKNKPLQGFVSHKPLISQYLKREKKGKMTESTHQKSRRVRPVCYGQAAPVGSGMIAVFLNGSNSKNGSNGTGVFLPTDSRKNKKPGCSAALVPTRVLQALDRHFKSTESLSPLGNLCRIQPTCQGQRGGVQPKLRLQSTSTDHVEKKLPQEWTY